MQLAEAVPFDPIFLANQLAGNKRATLAYVPVIDLLHYGFALCPFHPAAALFRAFQLTDYLQKADYLS